MDQVIAYQSMSPDKMYRNFWGKDSLNQEEINAVREGGKMDADIISKKNLQPRLPTKDSTFER